MFDSIEVLRAFREWVDTNTGDFSIKTQNGTYTIKNECRDDANYDLLAGYDYVELIQSTGDGEEFEGVIIPLDIITDFGAGESYVW